MKNFGKFLSVTVLSAMVLGSMSYAGTSWTGGRTAAWTDDEPSAPVRRSTAREEGAYNRSRKSLTPFAPGSHNLAFDVGQVFLMGDLGSKVSDAIGFQGHYTYGVSEVFAFDSTLGYSGHSQGKYSVNMLSLASGLRANFTWFDKVIPYGTVGLGFYRPDITDPAFGSVSPVLFGVHAGVGADLVLTQDLFFGAGLTFHDMFHTSKLVDNGQTISIGGTYTSFLVHLGMSI